MFDDSNKSILALLIKKMGVESINKETGVPKSLIRCYLDDVLVSKKHEEEFQSLYNRVIKEELEKEKSIPDISNFKDFKDNLNELIVCLNKTTPHKSKTNKVFWPSYDKKIMSTFDPMLSADIYGICTVSREIYIKYGDETTMQPYEHRGEYPISLFFVIDYIPTNEKGIAWSNEEFLFVKQRGSFFYKKKCALEKRGITYVCGPDIDRIVETVNSEQNPRSS